MNFELTTTKKEIYGVTFYQIKRCSTQELGGWVEKEINLSQDGDARISGNALISGDALISGPKDILTIGLLGNNHTLTAIKNTQQIIVDCFIGSLAKFKGAVKKKYPKGSDYDIFIPVIKKWMKKK